MPADTQTSGPTQNVLSLAPGKKRMWRCVTNFVKRHRKHVKISYRFVKRHRTHAEIYPRDGAMTCEYFDPKVKYPGLYFI
jgi:hypothetical protein